ncbi:MAG: hypothetical protein M1824_000190 [Vezdaea acicularis]|nr:MAG: hypothetical protein M1824_000190 [Vezdaea acicularis]
MAELLRSFFAPGDSRYFSHTSPSSPPAPSRSSPFAFSYAHPQARHPETSPPPPPSSPPQETLQIQALPQTEQTSQIPPPAEDPSKPDPPKKKYPKGVVLGADGKPCRSCTSFAAWSQLASSTSHSSSSSSSPPLNPPDCPPTTEVLGAATWTFLHTLTAAYPVTPTSSQRAQMTSFLRLFAQLYPCAPCATDFQTWIASRGGDEDLERAVRSRSELGTWMCEAHNEVNRKLGKEMFDCARWEERWRDGWRDGRCG